MFNIGDWTYTLFLVGADRELLRNSFLEQTKNDGRYSPHDSPRMGNV